MEANTERDDGLLPFLSFSRIDKYLTCPEKYRLYYVERLRPLIPTEASSSARPSIRPSPGFSKPERTP